MTSAVLSQDEQNSIAYVTSLCAQHDGQIANDFSDPHDVAFFQTLARINGMTSQRYPAFFGMINATKTPAPSRLPDRSVMGEDQGAFTPGQAVTFVGKDVSGKATGAGIFTRTKEIALGTIYISVINQNGPSTTVLANGVSQITGGFTAELATNPQTAQPPITTGTTSGVLAWSIRYADGTTESSTSSTPWAFNTNGDPQISAPVVNPQRTTGNLNNIMVGLARGYNTPGQNSDIDYWFWQNQFENTTLLVPMVGSMFFNAPIAPLSSGTNPVLKAYLARKEGGMNELSAQQTQQYFSCFQIDPQNPAKINFTMQAQSQSAGTAINFGLSPWVADTQTFFTGMVFVMLQNGQPAWSSIVSSLTPDNDPTDGVLYIKPIIYVWHCLVAGTQVTMADGTTRAVESLNSGDVVKSGGTTTRTVQATLAQPHWGTVYTLNLAGGGTLTGSGTHPIITQNGPVQLASLTVGTPVNVTYGSGSDRVASITQSQQSGEGLFNLWLDSSEPGAPTLIANSIYVGDYQMQVDLLPGVRDFGSLPPDVRTDATSHAEDQAKLAAFRAERARAKA